MSDLQAYYNNFASQPSRWMDSDPARCGCRGSGWWASEVDTWHECPVHFTGQTHPEDHGPDDDQLDLDSLEDSLQGEPETEVELGCWFELFGEKFCSCLTCKITDPGRYERVIEAHERDRGVA